jgi:uncharacterized membrane protein YhfC
MKINTRFQLEASLADIGIGAVTFAFYSQFLFLLRSQSL